MKILTSIVFFFIVCTNVQSQVDTTQVIDFYERPLYSIIDSSSVKYTILEGNSLNVLLFTELESEYSNDINSMLRVISKELRPSNRFSGIKKVKLGILFNPQTNRVIELRILRQTEISISDNTLQDVLFDVNARLSKQKKIYNFSEISFFSVEFSLTCMCGAKE